MADELHTPNHRWYEPRNHIPLAKDDVSKQWIFDSGIQKIDAFIAEQPWGGGGAFSPASLFASGEEGAWYEPSTTTAFKSTTDLTPCGYGDGAGFLLDKSKGAGYADGSFTGLGSELITGDSSTFTSSLGSWTYYTGATASAVDGKFSIGAIGTYRISNFLTFGKTYFIQFDWTRSATSSVPYVGDRLGTSTQIRVPTGGALSGTATGVIVCGNSDAVVGSASGAVTIDNISVRELPGNHATQVTAGARPILARVPEGGRRNLLERTEEFDDAYWGAINGDLTSNSFSDNGGGDNSRMFTLGLTGIISAGGAYTFSIDVAPNGYDWVRLRLAPDTNFSGAWFNLSGSGSVGTEDSGYTGTITSIGGGYYRCTVSVSSYPSGTNPRVGLSLVDGDGVITSSSTSSGVFIKNAQLETGSTATAYQKVVDEYDITEAGVTSLEYLSFDGSDDELIHNGVLLNAATAVSQFNSTQRQEISGSNILYRIALHDGGLSGGNNYVLDRHNSGGNHGFFVSDGSSSAGASVGTSTNLVTYITGQIVSSGSQTYRINGAVEGSGTVSLSSVTTDVLVIGGSGFSTAFWEGKYFGGLVVDRTLTTQEISNTEAYLANRSGVVL